MSISNVSTRSKGSDKVKDRKKDTIVAYHEYLQGQVREQLNGISIGPARPYSLAALVLVALAFACLMTGILLIALRYRHIYLVDIWQEFVGPFFLILCLLLLSGATYLIVIAKRKANKYRRRVRFRPMGDYGVMVVHSDKLTIASDLQTGTAPHRGHALRPQHSQGAAAQRHQQRQHRSDQNGQRQQPQSRGQANPGYVGFPPADQQRRPPRQQPQGHEGRYSKHREAMQEQKGPNVDMNPAHEQEYRPPRQPEPRDQERRPGRQREAQQQREPQQQRDPGQYQKTMQLDQSYESEPRDARQYGQRTRSQASDVNQSFESEI